MDLVNKIDLRKKSVIDLKKQSGIGGRAKAQVVLVLDYSGSMGGLYRNGTVQDVVERILPFGLAFDDDGSVDTYIFDTHYNKITPSVTVQNLKGFVDNNITSKYSFGGTTYSPVLKAIKEEFQTKPTGTITEEKKGGFLGGLFGKKAETVTATTYEPMEYPVYVIYITDGENDYSDNQKTEQVITEMAEQGFFIQFIGIGNSSFSLLEGLDNMTGRRVDNTNFFKVNDIKNMSDDDLYKGLMKEFPEWMKTVKNLNLIK